MPGDAPPGVAPNALEDLLFFASGLGSGKEDAARRSLAVEESPPVHRLLRPEASVQRDLDRLASGHGKPPDLEAPGAVRGEVDEAAIPRPRGVVLVGRARFGGA